MKTIPITKPYFKDDEIQGIRNVLESGWVTQGPIVAEFEQAFRKWTGAQHAMAVTSCTTALHVALAALGIGEGDEVIVPSFTFVATANVVEHCRARAVFCDIDLATYNIDASKLEACITPRTRAIIPVHLFGLSASMDPVLQIAARHDLRVIEDAACGFGAYYHGKHAGTMGDAGCFSFHPRKAVTTGEGGMVITGSEGLAARIRSLRDHGSMISDLHRHLAGKPYTLPDVGEPGFNYRMTDLQAALGVSQMEHADFIQKSRAAIARKYDEALEQFPWLRRPACPEGLVHGYQSYVCLYEPEKITAATLERVHEGRNAFMDHLQNRGVSTRPGTQAVHLLQYYRGACGLGPEDLINTTIAHRCTVTLPLYVGMTEEDFGYVIDSIKEFTPPCAA